LSDALGSRNQDREYSSFPAPRFFRSLRFQLSEIMVQFESALDSTSEQTPLIPGRTSSTGRSRSRSHERSRFSPATLIIPIAIICRFALLLVTTTTFRIIRIVSCQLWYWMNDPSSIPSDGHIPDALCKIPAVDKYFVAITTLFAALGGVACEFFSFNGHEPG